MTRPITVLHIADKFGVRGSSIHGVSRLFAWWFPRFDRQRYDVRLVGLRAPDAASETLRQQGVDVHCLGKSKFDLSTVTALVRLIRAQRPALLHLHGYGASNFGRIAARMTGLKTIVHEHFVDPAMPSYQRPVDWALARWTDRGIAVSHSVKEFMVRQRGIPAPRVDVIFNGAPLQEFQPVNGAAAAAERRKWNIPEGTPVIASIGRLDEQKGNRYFLEAAATLLRRGRQFRVMIVGDGPYMERLQAQCRNAGIAERTVFTGYQSDVARLQSLIDIQVFPSLWEGTPLTLFEAMAMARPIVSTTVDGLGEVLRDGANARLVPPRDADALAAAIDELLLHPERAKRLAGQALADSRAFDIQRTVDTMQRIYDELLVPADGSV